MSDDPFPGSSADFYERIQVLKAEIERLSALVTLWSETGSRYEHKISDQKKLITELVDALSHYALLSDFEKSLIQRAREAI